jgi:hypothetical protein
MATTVPRLHGLVSEAEITGKETDSEAMVHEGTPEEITREMLTFSKKRVDTIEEIAHCGHFQSGLCPKVTTMVDSPIANESAIEDDEDVFPDSPPESLVMVASVCMDVNDQLQSQRRAGERQPPLVTPKRSTYSSLQQAPVEEAVVNQRQSQCHEEPDTEQASLPPVARKRSSSSTSTSSSLLQGLVNLFTGRIIVNLFAGRKRSSKFNNREPLKESRSDSSDTTSTNSHDGISWSPPSQPAHTPTPASPPKLTHRQVIPPIHRPTAQDPSRRPGYKRVPPAPEHRFTGYGVMAEDVFTPATIQRGFDVPTSPPLGHRRNRSAGNLLDRDGDVWARWYDSKESGVFAREQTNGS